MNQSISHRKQKCNTIHRKNSQDFCRKGRMYCTGFACPSFHNVCGNWEEYNAAYFCKNCGWPIAFSIEMLYNNFRAVLRCADVAQSVERILGKDEVTGSNPVISSRNPSEMKDFFLVLGRILHESQHKIAFLLTSILQGRFLSVFSSAF